MNSDGAIRVEFPRNQKAGRWRSVRVFIDGDNVGSVRNGGATEFQVSKGVHAVQTRMDWLRSPSYPVVVEQGATVVLLATSKEVSRAPMVDLILKPGTILSLRVAPTPHYDPQG